MIDVTQRTTVNIAESTADITSSSGISDSKLESLSQVENKAYVSSTAFSIDVNLNRRVNSVSNAFTIANKGVEYSQVTNIALSYQNDMLESVKNKLILAQKDTTTQEGREVLRTEINDILTKFDKIASEGNFNDMYFMQTSNSDDGGSIIHNFQISEFPEITVSNDSIRSNTQGLGLSTLKNLSADGLTTEVASEQSGIVDGAITSIEGFQELYKEFQAKLQSSVSSLNNYYKNLRTQENELKEINYQQESKEFDKSKILSKFGEYASSQANITQNVVGALLTSMKSTSFAPAVSTSADVVPSISKVTTAYNNNSDK